MSDVDIAVAGGPAGQSSTRAHTTTKSSVRLVRLAVEKPQAAVDFLHARSGGVMDLIAHFWGRLSQTPPLSRGDLHLVAAVPETGNDIGKDYISTNIHETFSGAMLYVPKAHRADVLALDPLTSAAFAAYISHQGPRAVRGDLSSPPPAGKVEMGEIVPPESAEDRQLSAADRLLNGSAAASVNPTGSLPEKMPASGPTLLLSDLSGTAKGGIITTEMPSDLRFLTDAIAPAAASSTAVLAAKVPIDFLTGHAEGIHWMTPPLLTAVNRKTPAREMVNVVMQLPPDAPCESDGSVRIAHEADLPTLNRWRRQYKEERGILFDADMDAWVQTGRVFVYEHDKQVVALAKFDLELPGAVEIGGVYTFPEFRTRGFGTRIVADLAVRIRQMNKIPTLQVDEKNARAVSLYEGMGWRARGKLARVWLTG